MNRRDVLKILGIIPFANKLISLKEKSNVCIVDDIQKIEQIIYPGDEQYICDYRFLHREIILKFNYMTGNKEIPVFVANLIHGFREFIVLYVFKQALYLVPRYAEIYTGLHESHSEIVFSEIEKPKQKVLRRLYLKEHDFKSGKIELTIVNNNYLGYLGSPIWQRQ